MRSRLTPSTVLAAAALFFALGGSALAVSNTVRPQARCADGAVRGIAAVTGDPSKGIGNLPDQFSSSKTLFSHQFNCTGGATQVRRISTGVYEVRFAGNRAGNALASATGAETVVQPSGDAFRVTLYAPGSRNDLIETPFVVVVM
jgi:hypothetical protein